MRKDIRRVGRICRATAPLFLVVVIFLSLIARAIAHKPVTSKYDYDRDVFPILRARCSQCHVRGGPAPMSLMTYKDAVSWAESIRVELTTGRMPPWPVDALSPAVKGGQSISAKEIDTIVTWASGGTPSGTLSASLPETAFLPAWSLGPPDFEMSMEAAHTVATGTVNELCTFSLPTHFPMTKWVRAVDLKAGTPSLVRDAIISIENGPVLGVWEPGGDATAVPSGAAFRLPSGSTIQLQIHYRKHFDQEQEAVTDRSTIGLYFTDVPTAGRPIESLAIVAPPETDAGKSRTFSGTLTSRGLIIALRPLLNASYQSLDVDEVTRSGRRVPLLALRGPRPQWFRDYWLKEPIEVESGSRIEVRATPLSADADEPKVRARFPLQVVLDYVPQ